MPLFVTSHILAVPYLIRQKNNTSLYCHPANSLSPQEKPEQNMAQRLLIEALVKTEAVITNG